MSNVFKGIENVNFNNASPARGSFLPAGFSGVCKIINVKSTHSLKTDKDLFIAELEVIDSNHSDVKPGQFVTFMENRRFDMGTNNPGLARIKQFMAAAAGSEIDMNSITEQQCTELCQPGSPLIGNKLKVITQHNKSGKFTLHFFQSV